MKRTNNIKIIGAGICLVALLMPLSITVTADEPLRAIPDGSHIFDIIRQIQNGQQYQVSPPEDPPGPPLPYVAVNVPNGGETWYKSLTYEITWSWYNAGNNVKIELYLYQEPMSVSYITSNTQNDGVYTWTIPANQATASNYKVKITSISNPSLFDYSDNYFTITTEPTPPPRHIITSISDLQEYGVSLIYNETPVYPDGSEGQFPPPFPRTSFYFMTGMYWLVDGHVRLIGVWYHMFNWFDGPHHYANWTGIVQFEIVQGQNVGIYTIDNWALLTQWWGQDDHPLIPSYDGFGFILNPEVNRLGYWHQFCDYTEDDIHIRYIDRTFTENWDNGNK